MRSSLYCVIIIIALLSVCCSDQNEFVCCAFELLKSHIELVVPLGPDCVGLACGGQSKPLRDLLIRLIDSKLTPTMSKVQYMIYYCIFIALIDTV